MEGFIPTTGRAIQGATSHCLGQNFSKMFDILVSNENAERVHVWQNSWGLTTRTIGVMVMVHGDDKGLVLPPRVASVQVIVIPVGLASKVSEDKKKAVYEKAEEIVTVLKNAGVRVKSDLRENYTVGYKYNDWEMRVRCFAVLWVLIRLSKAYNRIGCSSPIGSRTKRYPKQRSPVCSS